MPPQILLVWMFIWRIFQYKNEQLSLSKSINNQIKKIMTIPLLPIFILDEQSDRTNQVLLVCLDEYSYKKKSIRDCDQQFIKWQ